MGNKPIFCYVIFLANTVKQEAFLWYGHVERYWRDVKLYIRGGCCCWNILPVQVVTEIQLSFDSPRWSVLSCVSLKWPTWSAAANPTQGCQHLQRILPRNEALEQWGHGQWVMCPHSREDGLWSNSESSTCYLWKCGPSVKWLCSSLTSLITWSYWYLLIKEPTFNELFHWKHVEQCWA